MSQMQSEIPRLGASPVHPAETPARAAILLVDDQPGRLLSYEAILSDLAPCVRALSGAQALQRLLQQEFAAILLDVNMPEMDGFEVARLIRSHPRIERTPIVFVTAESTSEFDRLRGYEVGAIDYVAVPVVPEILRSKVAVLLELHERRTELQMLNRELAQARAQAEAQHAAVAAERETLLHATFEHPTEMMVLLQAERDAGGAIVDWIYRNANENSLKLLGHTRQTLIGRRLSEVLPQRFEHLQETCTRVLISREPVRYEIQNGDRDFLVTLFALGADSVVSAGLDITERKRAETALRTSEARQRALIENAPVGIAYVAFDGGFEYVNLAFCELVGFGPDELLATRWQSITHPDDVESDQAMVARIASGELPWYSLDKRYVRKDGSIVWVNLFCNVARTDDGTPIHVVAMVTDISERKRTIAALHESRERLLQAKAAARLGTYDCDIAARTIEWDELTHAIWGTQHGVPVSYEDFLDAVHAEDRPQVEAALRRALDPTGTGDYRASYRVIHRRTGETRWVDATGKVSFADLRPTRLVGTVLDVTERMATQENLRASEARFRELANTIDQFVWICDNDGYRSWYNDRWYQYCGGTLEQMRGFGWQTLHHPEHFDRVFAHLQACLRTGEAWEDTYPLRGKDGTYRWFLSRAVPIRDDSGHVARWLGTNTDVTEQRELQDALQEADRRKDEFLAMLAHELRNPVAPIANAAEVLGRLALDEKQRMLVGIVQRQSANLARLLDDLLDVARITRDRIELRREPIALDACVELALETTAPLITERGHHLSVERAPRALTVLVDKVRLAQCLANLINNAAKYTNPGGDIRIVTRAEDDSAVVEISDTGMGIAAEFLPRVFDLFVQSERALDRAPGGLGIGLSVCKRLLEMHGGSIAASSAGLGHGATFTVRLPLADVRHEDAGSGPRVLIVDDNDDAAQSLALLLELEGHCTQSVNSGAKALDAFAAFAPQFVLLDIGLPDMDGYAVARRLRALAPEVRLIAVSGHGQPEDRARSAAAGFDAHLVKPLDPEALKRLLAPSR